MTGPAPCGFCSKQRTPGGTPWVTRKNQARAAPDFPSGCRPGSIAIGAGGGDSRAPVLGGGGRTVVAGRGPGQRDRVAGEADRSAVLAVQGDNWV